MYDSLSYAHRQHHSIVEALESGQSVRVAGLMYEHACETKTSINLGRKVWRSGSADGHATPEDSGSANSEQD
jgi:hypothetical protein